MPRVHLEVWLDDSSCVLYVQYLGGRGNLSFDVSPEETLGDIPS